MAATIFWFRRDLRLADNPALAAAAAAGPVLGAFIVDPMLWKPAGDARRAFLGASLAALDTTMGGNLTVGSGSPAEVLSRMAADAGASTVVATADHGPYGARRDEAVAAALAARGVTLELVDSPYAVAPGLVRGRAGGPYKVFTPFYRAWLDHGWAPPSPAVTVDWLPPVDGADLASVTWPDSPLDPDAVPPAGEAAAQARLEGFVCEALGHYADRRDIPGVDGTSRLSPYLKWGALHPRQVLDALGSTPGAEKFRSEIAWREFYADVLHHRPDSAREAFVARMGAIEVDEGPDADARFDAWAEGRTGYPIIDAGMRQLRATGWIHNRVRMLVASFLVKDLHLDWRRGARWFMRHLVDGDLASNNHGWQWVAGTGTDAAPYFRVFNPTTQAKKFDPDGTYVRRWVPELAHLPDRYVHEPWVDRHGAPAGYPPPLVDHGAERVEALARYERVKGLAT